MGLLFQLPGLPTESTLLQGLWITQLELWTLKQTNALKTSAMFIEVSDNLICCLNYNVYNSIDPVLCVAWSPEGSNIASGSDDGSLKVFNFQMNKLHHSFDELYVGKKGFCKSVLNNLSLLLGSVSSVAWSPDGIQIASASHTAIKIVDYYNKKLVHTFKELHTGKERLPFFRLAMIDIR